MIYTDYAFYRDTFHGALTEPDFDRLVVPASAYLDRFTFGRAAKATRARIRLRVQLACCSVVDGMAAVERGEYGVQAETNDGISVTYASGAGKSRSETGVLRDAAARYLGGSGLLYRGVR